MNYYHLDPMQRATKIARCYTKSFYYVEALRVYDRYIRRKHFPSFEILYAKACLLYKKMNRCNEALKTFNKCAKINKRHSNVYFHKALIYLKLKKYKQSGEEFVLCIDASGGYQKLSFLTHYSTAEMNKHLGNYKKATEDYRYCITYMIQALPEKRDKGYSCNTSYPKLTKLCL